jgi:predicted lactoylglutathione lyase
MDRMIFINLPVQDLPASKEFYTGLGFTINEPMS